MFNKKNLLISLVMLGVVVFAVIGGVLAHKRFQTKEQVLAETSESESVPAPVNLHAEIIDMNEVPEIETEPSP